MGHEGEVWALAVLADGPVLFLASGGADGTVRIRELESNVSFVD
jgi:hypothetical protein